MKFYLNEIGLVSSWPTNFVDSKKEVEDIYSKIKEHGYDLYIKESFFTEPLMDELYKELNTKGYEYFPFIDLLGKCKRLQNIDTLGTIAFQSDPVVSDVRAIDLFKFCVRDYQEQIASISVDTVLINSKYQLSSDLGLINVENIIGVDQMEHFIIHNPPCASIEEVFRKIEQLCPHLKFTDKSFSTARKRQYQYRNFGYENMLDILILVEKLIYPYLSKQIRCTEKEIMHQFAQKSKVEFSPEDETTMQMYGELREVTIEETTYRFSYHLKPDDNRIYFKYFPDRDIIYFGYAGKHLKTFNRRK